MAEKSYWWTTGGAGDGAATYTRQDHTEWARVVAACEAFEGVAPAYLNALVGSVPAANTARIGTGGALVDGKPYYNSAAVDVNIPSAVGGGNTRIDRIVLRANWTAQTVRITRIAGTDAASPAAPAITQTPSTTYDIPLYQALVTTGGVVTLTDERTFALPTGLTHASLANRARKFMASVLGSYDTTTPTFTQVTLPPGGGVQDRLGLLLKDNVDTWVDGSFIVPSDYASGLTLKALVVPKASANMRAYMTTTGGQPGAAYNGHTAPFVAPANIAVTASLITAVITIDLSAAGFVAGDIVVAHFERQGSNAGDTMNDTVHFYGFLVEYTADM